MHVAYTTMNTPEELGPQDLARVLVERGYESLWTGEHAQIPTSRKTPYPAGGDLPPPYLRMMDPFISLALAATAEPTLKVGLGVALPLEHDLFVLAKAAATLDLLTGGRVHFGVGVGWNEEELATVSTIPWAQRYRALEDAIGALKALWTQDEAEYHGEFFDFEPVWSYPKPAQRPHPPIYCGTGGKLGTQHAVRWADAWMPMDITLGDVPRKVAKFRQIAADAGRGDIPITMVTFGNPTAEALERYRELDIERVIIGAGRKGWTDPSTTMGFLDRYAELIPELKGS